MKIRAQIGMVLNLDKCIGCAVTTTPPAPALPPQGDGGRTMDAALVGRSEV